MGTSCFIGLDVVDHILLGQLALPDFGSHFGLTRQIAAMKIFIDHKSKNKPGNYFYNDKCTKN